MAKPVAFYITATADVATFTEGQKLSKRGDIIAYHRELLNMAREEGETTLTDDQIWTVIRTVAADNADAETARHEALEALDTEQQDADDTETDADGSAEEEGEETEETEGEDDQVPAQRLTDVEKEAAKIAEDASPEMQEAIRGLILAGRTVKTGPLVLLTHWRAMRPKDDDRLVLPLVGSSWKERKPGSNEPVDKRRILVRGKKGLKPSTVSLFDLILSAMPAGKEIQDKIDMIDRRETDRAANKPNVYSQWKDHDASGERETLVGDRTQARTAFKRAVKLDRMLLDVASKLSTLEDGIEVTWKKDSKGNPVTTGVSSRYPIRVIDKRDRVGQPMSIDQFLGLKVDEALDPKIVASKGGIFEAFTQSGGGGGDAETPTTTALDIETYMASVGMIASYMTNEENRSNVKRRFYKDDDEGRAFMVSMIELHDEVHEWCNDPIIRKRYAKATATDANKKAAA